MLPKKYHAEIEEMEEDLRVNKPATFINIGGRAYEVQFDEPVNFLEFHVALCNHIGKSLSDKELEQCEEQNDLFGKVTISFVGTWTTDLATVDITYYVPKDSQ